MQQEECFCIIEPIILRARYKTVGLFLLSRRSQFMRKTTISHDRKGSSERQQGEKARALHYGRFLLSFISVFRGCIVNERATMVHGAVKCLLIYPTSDNGAIEQQWCMHTRAREEKLRVRYETWYRITARQKQLVLKFHFLSYFSDN